jgi:hypothetical protein
MAELARRLGVPEVQEQRAADMVGSASQSGEENP